MADHEESAGPVMPADSPGTRAANNAPEEAGDKTPEEAGDNAPEKAGGNAPDSARDKALDEAGTRGADDAGDDAGDKPARPGGDLYDWYQRGMQLLSRGEAAAAAQLLGHAARVEPGSRSIREALSRAHFDSGRYAEAAESFRSLVDANPGDDYAHFGLGLAAQRLGDLATAAEHLALAAAMRPDNRDYNDALRGVRATRRARREEPTPAQRPAPTPARRAEPTMNPGASAQRRDATPAALPRGCPVPLTEAYDAALLDLDGVVYIGPAPVNHAAEALDEARRRGMRLAFVTNNASRPPQAVADHLNELGIPARRDEIATSAQAAARMVAELVPPGSAVLVVGGLGLEEALRERALRPVRSVDDDPAAVIQGFHPKVGWEQLAEGAYAVQRGVPWVASNLDLTLPTARGLAPGNGSLVGVIAAASGRTPLVAGKPELPLHQEAIARTSAQRPLVVGDRLDTDIEGAVKAATDSLLVLTGVTRPAGLLGAAPHLRPTYIAADLRGLLTPHPSVTREPEGTWACGGWIAQLRDGRLLVSGEGDRYDGLRAACAACWERAPGDQPVGTSEGLGALGW